MAGISAISLIRYMQTLQFANGENNRLTETTKAKLIALGVDITGIVTESEGQTKLREAEFERISGPSNQSKKTSENNSALQEARKLANDLNVSYSDTDTVDDLIGKISTRINELKIAAGDDFDKKEKVVQYERRLEEIINSYTSQLQLDASMSLMSNLNIAFHGLY